MTSVNNDIIETTKTTILKVIKKPTPTDKLLQRPPFKFIQDVIIAVINATKFKEDLYTAEEITADLSKNREGKINFLEKAITAVEEALDEKLDVKASKVIAGLEVDKTNIFLTKFVQVAIENGLSNQANKQSSESNATSSSQGRKVSPVGKKSVANAKAKIPAGTKLGRPVKKPPISGQDAKDETLGKSMPVEEPDEVEIDPKKSSSEPPELSVRPPTGSVDTRASSSIPRPTTARAAPPRVIKKAAADDAIAAMAAQEEQIRLKSGRGMKNLIIEHDTTAGDEVNDDDDKLFVVDDGTSQFDSETTGYMDMVDFGKSDPLDTKGSLTQQLENAKIQLQRTPGDETTMIDESTSSVVAINEEKLRENLQKLTRITNPFGRLLDALQEDVDFMFTEYKTWLDEYKRNSHLLEAEMESDDPSLAQLNGQLEVLDKNIAAQIEQIASIKSSIEMKDDKLRRMITLAVSDANRS